MSSATAALLVVTLSTAGLAPAEPGSSAWVREVAEAAAKDVERGRYEQAAERLEQAYAEEPLPSLLFMLARVEETRGDCDAAVEHYEKFLMSEVPAEDEREARAGLERCRGEEEKETTAEADEAEEPETEPPDRKRWYADPLGGAATVLGVVGIGVGTGLLLQAQQDQRAADDAGDLSDFDDHARRAERFSQAGVITLSVGLGLLVVGVVRYAVVGARERRVRMTANGVAVRF